jgi:uracil-DNA glycosylase family 4
MPDSRVVSRDESACTRCRLSQTRTQVVVGRGWERAPVMFLGEAPGRAEDQSGLGFQGAAGRRFEGMLAGLGLSRRDIWLANAVRCRPSVDGRRNRAPRPEEIQACRHWLTRDMERVRPKIVVTLGRVAFESVSGRVWSPDLRAQPLAVPEFGIVLFALYHPAYLIYRRDLIAVYRADLLALRRELQRLGIPLADPEDLFAIH